MPLKNQKEMFAFIASLGLTVIATRQGKHLIARLRNKHGVEGSFTIGGTESDRRAYHNKHSLLRRFAERTK